LEQRHNEHVQQALGILIFVVVILAALIAVAGFAARSRAYDEIGRGGLSFDRPPPEPAASGVVRDAEIRQMLAARNERRARRGEPPLDVEAELAKLTGAAALAADPELEAEVRSLVLARNERRARRGEPPLDIEAEVRRHLDAMS
jgi:hypothetical protein